HAATWQPLRHRQRTCFLLGGVTQADLLVALALGGFAVLRAFFFFVDCRPHQPLLGRRPKFVSDPSAELGERLLVRICMKKAESYQHGEYKQREECSHGAGISLLWGLATSNRKPVLRARA